MFKKVLFSFLLLAVGAWLVVDDLFAPLAPVASVVEIPDFVGSVAQSLAPDEAIALQTEYRYDPNTPQGTVISQDPIGGSRRKRPTQDPITVKLVVSLGTETVEVPVAIGQDQRLIAARLRELGCVVEISYQSGSRPTGEVLWIEPRAGTEVPKGTRVLLTVCAGTAEESVTVPDFCGMPRADALVQLWLSRLSLAEVVETESEKPEGTVVRQSHPAGSLVPSGTRVTLYVSRFAVE